MVIGSIYHPPNTSVQNFLTNYAELCEKLDAYKHVIIGLDHNLDLLKSSSHSQTQQFLETTIENNLIPTITKPTRVKHTSATLIDNIFLRSNIHEMHQSRIIINNISDHYPSLLTIENVDLTKTIPQKIKKRKIGNKEIKEIKSKILSYDWESELSNLNGNEFFNYFHDKLMTVIDRVAPEKEITRSTKKLTVPWYSIGLKKSSERDKCLYKISKHPSASLAQIIRYKEYHVEFQRTKRKAKQLYYRGLCLEFQHNSAKIWKLVKTISGKVQNKGDLIERLKINNIQYETGTEITNELAKHFSSIGEWYANHIEKSKTSCTEYLNCIPSSYCNIFLDANTPIEINNLIPTLPNKRSSG